MADSCGDGLFGPGLNSICRGGFDFTLLFEDSILNLLPTACFLVLAPLRIWQLSSRRNLIRRSSIYLWKLGTASILAVIEAVALGFAATSHGQLTEVALPASVLDLVACLALASLVYLEHFRSIRPSLLAVVFLSLTGLLDIARLRSAWLQLGATGWTASLTASLVAKLLLISLESVEKQSLMIFKEKPLSRESTSGPYNRALFLWLNSLLKTGWQATLKPDTLEPLDERLEVQVVFERLRSSWLSVDRKKKYSLLFALLKTFKMEMLAVVIPRLCLIGLSIAQPFMIGQTVNYLQDTSTASKNTGYGLLGAFVLVFTLTAVCTALYQHLGYRVMTMIRGGLIATLYKHMMSLPAESVSESGALALMGSDAEGFAEYFHATITDSWAGVLQLAVAIALLARMIGSIVVVPLIVAVLFTGLSFKVGDMISGRQRTWFQATERRVNFTTEIMGRVRDVKILGLSDHLLRTITGLRDEELEKSRAFRRVSCARVCLVNSPTFLAQFAVFAAYGIAASIKGTGQLSVSETVTTLSLMNLLLSPLQSLLYAIPETYSSLSCLRRIQEFLAQDPQQERRLLGPSLVTSIAASGRDIKLGTHQSSDIELAPLTAARNMGASSMYRVPEHAISVQGVTYGWDTASDPNARATAEDAALSFTAPAHGSLTFITGPVGCGKSTLLRALLGETTFLRGNIVLTSSEIAYCSQDPWIVNGSIRHNIAGTDNDHVDTDWYTQVITACALDVDFARFPEGDKTLVGSKGVKLSGGQKQRITLARALYSKKRIVLLDDVLSGLDNATKSTVFHNVCGPTGLLKQAGCTTIMTAPLAAGQFMASADYIIVLGPGGRVVEQGTFAELKKAGSTITDLNQNHNVVSSDDTQEKAADEARQLSTADDETTIPDTPSPDLSIWKYYFSAMGWTNILLLGIFLTIWSVFDSLPYVWLTWWSSSSDAATSSNTGYWLGIYAVFGFISLFALALSVYWNWVVIVPKASAKLHSLLLAAAMGATPAFLSSTETGTLINRFSQDVRLVDVVLPVGFINTGFQLFGSLAFAGVAVASLPYLAPAIPLAAGVLVLIQRFYLLTSRQLRLLDIELKAPVFTHFIESLSGLVTIRAFGWREQYLDRSLELLGRAQAPYYLLLAVQRWLTLVLNLVVAAVAILLVGISIALRDRVTQPGLLGVALVMTTSLGSMITNLIQHWASLETSLGAISRVKAFAETTPQERPAADPAPDSPPPILPDTWPSTGGIEFTCVTASHHHYSVSSPPVLRDITLSIPPGAKVGIVGRTGSGKSSLLLSLLGMVPVVSSGRIAVDGVDVATLPPSLLRARLNCLTQEPFLFGGSVRTNADPQGDRSDAEILAALAGVGVLGAIVAKTGEGENPLDAQMDENFLSHGQRQLFAVARGMLRRSRVLLLDEPTSRLDATSHEQVQAAIRSHFAGCTVVMVAHRLDSLLDFDRVVVLDGGRVVEYESPTKLLADGGSAFSKLFSSDGSKGSR